MDAAGDEETGVTSLALLLNYANPIMAQGAAFADFPMIDRFEEDITQIIRTGDTVTVTVDPAAGTVIVNSTIRRGITLMTPGRMVNCDSMKR